jgi:hypothetical protein
MFVKERFLDTRFLDSDEPRKDVFGVQKLIQFSTSSKRYHLLYPTAASAALWTFESWAGITREPTLLSFGITTQK